MNLSCALGCSSSFICSQCYNESNEADIAKGYLPTSLLQARFDEYCLCQLETYKVLFEFLQIKNLDIICMTLQGCDYLPLMLFSENSGCMDSKSLNSIIILVRHMHRTVCAEVLGK